MTNADVIYDLLAPRHVYLNHRTSVVFTTSPNEANAAAGHILNPLSVASNGTFTDANLAMRFVYLILLNYRTDLAATLSRYTCAEKRRVIQGHFWPLGRNMASWFPPWRKLPVLREETRPAPAGLQLTRLLAAGCYR